MSFKTERAPKPLCIILGVTGSIAAYKAAEIASTLHQRGHDVHVVMTPSAQKLVTAATFHPLTGNPVHKDLWDEASLTGQARVTHVDLADRADVFAIAPATANTIGKIAHGIADSFLTTLLLAYPGKVLVAPAMNDNMFAHPSVQKNLETLRGFGYRMVAPGQGALACGREGLGRLADPEAIVRAIEALGAGKPTGPEHGGAAPRRVLVTAGPTREPIDAVRVLQNPSSGRMGDAIAAALAARGHEVTLVRGPIDRPAPSGLAQVVPVTTTRSMFEACQRVFPSVDAVIMAAAPCDWRAPAPASEKLKKETTGETLRLDLVRTEDILASLGAAKRSNQRLIGFALETSDGAARARQKLERKNLDLICLNGPDNFGNPALARLTLLGRTGSSEAVRGTKPELAEHLADRLERMFDPAPMDTAGTLIAEAPAPKAPATA